MPFAQTRPAGQVTVAQLVVIGGAGTVMPFGSRTCASDVRPPVRAVTHAANK